MTSTYTVPGSKPHTSWLYYGVPMGVLLVLLATVSIVIYLTSRAQQADQATYRAAQTAAESINNYVNKKEAIPADLAAAGYTAKRSDIAFHRDSQAAYTFCVVYHRAGTVRMTSAGADLPAAAFDALASLGDNYSDAYTSKDYLYIPASHLAGRQCQTITPTNISVVKVLDKAANGHTGS